MLFITVLSCVAASADGVRNHLDHYSVARAVQLLEDGDRQCEVARRFGVSPSVVCRLWQRYRETGLYTQRPRTGRPRVLTARQDRYLTTLARRNRRLDAVSLRNEVQDATGRRVSVQTILNRLHTAGLHARRPAVAPPLTRAHRRARLHFAREHVAWTLDMWRPVLFTDESRFCVSGNDRRQRIWREQGRRYNDAFFHEYDRFGGQSVMVWAGISLDGRTDLHVFERGAITARVYRDDIVRDIVRPFAVAVGPDFLLMDDNAPIHRARIVSAYEEDEGIVRMDWPARSPDLNPIEHLWDILRRAVQGRHRPPATRRELAEALVEERAALGQEQIVRLIRSMPRRCQACIQARGGHTRY